MTYLTLLFESMLTVLSAIPAEAYSLLPLLALGNVQDKSAAEQTKESMEDLFNEFDGEKPATDDDKAEPEAGDPPVEDNAADDPPTTDDEPDKDKNKSEDSTDKKSAEQKEKETGEDEDPDLVEHDGEKYFYHPDVHAKGEQTHPNFYKSRDKAEEAGVAKIGRISERIEQLKEAGKDVGAIKVPSFLEGKLEDIQDIADLQEFATMDSENLRNTLKELDQFDIRLDGKIERVVERKEQAELSKELAEKRDKTVEFARELAKFDDKLIDRIDSESHKGIQLFQDAVDKAINEQVKPEEDALEEWVEEQESTGELSLKEFREQYTEKERAIADKKENLESQYSEQLRLAKDFIEKANKQASGKKKMSREDLINQAAGTFDEFVDDIQGQVEVLEKDGNGNYAYPESVRAFQRYALHPDRTSKFNNFSSVRDWLTALQDYEKHKEDVRAKRESKKMGGSGKDKRSGSGNNKPDKNPPRPEPNKRYDQLTKDERYEREKKDIAAEFAM